MVPADIRRQVVLDEHDMSADGSVAVVARRIIRRDRYQTHLFVVPLDLGSAAASRHSAITKPRALTSGHVLDGWPRISPDGRHVAFVRDQTDDEWAIPRVCLMPIAGGRVRQIRATGYGSVTEVAWSPDGERLAFTASVDPPRFLVGHVLPAGRHHLLTNSDTSPVARRITRTDWRWDGVGHRDRWSHLFVVDARPGARPRQVTSGDWGVADIAWSPDGRTVAFTSDRGPDADLHPRTTIWAVDVGASSAADAEPREVLAPAGWANHPAWSPDGRWIVAIGLAEPEPLDDLSPGLLVGPSDRSGPLRALTPDLDRPIGNWTDTDLNGWMVSSRGGPFWPAQDLIVATVTDRARSRPTAFHLPPGLNGPASWRALVDGDITTHSLAVATQGPAAGAISWLGTDGVKAQELSSRGAGYEDRRPSARTTIGSAWQRRHLMPVMTRVDAPGPGGPIETWIASPPDAPDARLPTIVDVHGGPLGGWAPAPHIEVILLVAAGYRVILPNIRGSASYGRDWIRPQLGDWGGVDADDVHAALDHVIELGLVDPTRLGVLGLSYGGFMVNWLVGTTDRFAAAVSENGVTNQVSDWANSDSGPEYDRASLLGDPFSPEGIERLWRQSPLKNVAAIRTPLLMLQAEADLRCPPQDNEQLFVALRQLRRTVEYVLYPHESHVYGNAGRPDRRIDRQTRMLDWFDRYLRS